MKITLSKENKVTFSPITAKLAKGDSGRFLFEGVATRSGIQTNDFRNLTIAKTALVNQVGKKVEVYVDHEYSLHNKVGVCIMDSLTDEGDLLVKGEIVPGDTADHISKLLKIGAIVGLSIGFTAIDYEVLETEDGDYAGIVITKLDIFELSLVYEGAIEDSEVTKINFAKEQEQKEASPDSVEKTQDKPDLLKGFLNEVRTLINGD